jgi:hypothetical protein
MDRRSRSRLSRRTLAAIAAAVVAPATLRPRPWGRKGIRRRRPRSLPATPDCDDDPEPTVAQTEGPFFTPDAPERTGSARPRLPGEPLSLAGFVLDPLCRPVPGRCWSSGRRTPPASTTTRASRSVATSSATARAAGRSPRSCPGSTRGGRATSTSAPRRRSGSCWYAALLPGRTGECSGRHLRPGAAGGMGRGPGGRAAACPVRFRARDRVGTCPPRRNTANARVTPHSASSEESGP